MRLSYTCESEERKSQERRRRIRRERPSAALSVRRPTVWPPRLFMCKVRAGWHRACVRSGRVYICLALEPGPRSCAPVHPGHHPEDCSRT
ncbi:hypothetical protein EYF80_027505 [Liparis tanakae]|uniref:Uncharacterized protein n=1 Tax=Liparis tanakae TaxID=230148 RepID=A0A4Z2H9F3_9TELE|nr:hypothetical protein EYF80_027505 [Liparis tanakae]